MATWTKSDLAEWVLRHLGVLAAGETATSHDSNLVQEAIDACHEELRGERIAPFETSAIPEWAQLAMRDYVAAELAQIFGVNPQRRAELAMGQELAKRKLRRQMATYPNGEPTEATYY